MRSSTPRTAMAMQATARRCLCWALRGTGPTAGCRGRLRPSADPRRPLPALAYAPSRFPERRGLPLGTRGKRRGITAQTRADSARRRVPDQRVGGSSSLGPPHRTAGAPCLSVDGSSTPRTATATQAAARRSLCGARRGTGPTAGCRGSAERVPEPDTSVVRKPSASRSQTPWQARIAERVPEPDTSAERRPSASRSQTPRQARNAERVPEPDTSASACGAAGPVVASCVGRRDP